MNQPYSEDELAEARRAWEAYTSASNGIIQRLVKSCRDNKPEVCAGIAKALTEYPDANLLVMVLGQLTTAVVQGRRAVSDAHGPLLTAEELGFDPEQAKPELWQVAVADQLGAAAAENDYQQFAKLAVDSQIKAWRLDPMDWDDTLRALMLMDQQTITALATEMLCRLVREE